MTREKKSSKKKIMASGLMGTFVEWYDYAIYAYAAVVISEVFFSGVNPQLDLLLTLAILAVTFIFRPLGGLFWGRLGDRIGRQPVLAYTIVIMGAATTVMGLLPGYAVIGVWAPIFLVLLRMVQGFAGGGEYTGVMVFFGEHAPPNRRATWNGASVAMGAVPFAVAALVVLAMSASMPEDAYGSWGWRIPFLLAAPLSLIGLYIRKQVEDTPVFRSQADKSQVRWGEVSAQRKAMFLLFSVASLNAVAYYGAATYMATYMPVTLGYDYNTALLAISLTLLVYVPLCPTAGYLSDRIGRRKVVRGCLVGIFLLTIPGYALVGVGGLGFAILGMVVMLLPVIALGAVVATLQTELFPTRVRFASAGIAYNLAYALFGGTAAFVAALMVNWTGDVMAPAYYLVALCLLAAIPIFMIPETSRRDIQSLQPLFGTGEAGRDSRVESLQRSE